MTITVLVAESQRFIDSIEMVEHLLEDLRWIRVPGKLDVFHGLDHVGLEELRREQLQDPVLEVLNGLIARFLSQRIGWLTGDDVVGSVIGDVVRGVEDQCLVRCSISEVLVLDCCVPVDVPASEQSLHLNDSWLWSNLSDVRSIDSEWTEHAISCSIDAIDTAAVCSGESLVVAMHHVLGVRAQWIVDGLKQQRLRNPSSSQMTEETIDVVDVLQRLVLERREMVSVLQQDLCCREQVGIVATDVGHRLVEQCGLFKRAQSDLGRIGSECVVNVVNLVLYAVRV